MKKTYTQTIIVFIVLSLITATQDLAQDVVEEENQEVLETQAKEADLAQREAEIAARVAEKEAEVAAKVAEKEAEVADEIAESQAKVAQKQMEEAEVQMLITRDQLGKLKDKLVDLRLPEVHLPYLPHLQRIGSGGILVIPSAQMKVENLAAITEDMSVMSRIFDKQLSQSNVQTARGRVRIGFDPYYWRGNRTTEAIYLEGYGALFLMKVNMLLSQPPEEQQKKEPQEDTDPVWTQMRREMYEPEDARRRRGSDRPEEKYDAEKVETLKTNLIKTLKHATNIRALKSDQLVILTIIGDGNRSASTVTRLYSYGRGTGRGRIVQTLPEVEADSVQPTVLTICAKKSDIDAFAKGELDYEQFRKRTGIFKSYAKAGQQVMPSAELHQFAQEVHPVF